mmetsp:Transcript_31816/g.66394  ORF Transcript_31816/g.66394 Transcript_31816/m.66394 type:complete len:251 (-) Transcript_31816:1200-1952(-)|eukprot:CAMPEP_0171347124 /NCGR_PEP_ID=MMETSP0878-20121228/26999_1 /TAXON_ID=67004 /ORGANISM="Thalassiosira weissflogii, Strain CCMP1336" /LENGTH=250 /DNA_ID=CAMNT_0011851055 /DNA_START=40 /DNA_END=792 /DNA_ORIENTATION=-
MTRKIKLEADSKLVDVIFLDIDGVLLPFGDVVANTTYTDGCIFPDRNMDALTELLQKMSAISPAQASTESNADSTLKHKLDIAGTLIEGNPVLVLSSTWRARPAFITDILSSFRSYVGARKDDVQLQRTWRPHLDFFFDVVDPTFHASRHEEIYKWIDDHVETSTKSNLWAGGLDVTTHIARRKFIVRSWIALDDEDLVNVFDGRGDTVNHAIKTTSSLGLTSDLVDFAVSLISNQFLAYHGSWNIMVDS